MAGKITQKDITILLYIAEYKFLTVKQLAALTKRSMQVIRRRLRFFANENLVYMKERGFGKAAGRRKNLLLLTKKGISLLSDYNALSPNIAYVADDISNASCIDHDMLVSWFFIHLLQIERARPQFSIQHLTENCHNLKTQKTEKINLMESLPSSDGVKDSHTMIPDGVFTITDSESEKTLLFFLEVDMGTESMVNQKRVPGDIRHKILSYQTLYHLNQYKRYEKVFDAKLNGFRLLFLADSPGRKKAICDLVQSMHPSDFIWIAAQKEMFSSGLSAEIWDRGGRYGQPSESILNKKLAYKESIENRIR